MSGRPKVVVVLSKFPVYDEVFLLRELVALARHVELYLLSLRPPGDSIVHDEAVPLLERLLAPHFLLSLRVWAAQVRTLRRRPIAYLRAFVRTVLGNLRSPRFLAGNLAFFPKAVYLADWAVRHGVTHIHGGWATYPASAAMVASELTGIPFSFAGHAHDIYLDTTLLAEKIRRAAFVTTCTEANRSFLLALAPGLREDRVAVLRHGIALEEFVAPSRAATVPLEILSVGTLFPHKGHRQLVKALLLLRERGQPFRCTIVGGGPLRPELDALVRRHGLQGEVVLTGPLKQRQLVPHYRRASVFVLLAQPEWHWGVPNVLVEALAARVAVVTTRFGSVEELVRDGETGLLVPAKAPLAAAEAIRCLANDDARRRRLAEAGHRLVAEQFELAGTVRGYLERIERASEGRHLAVATGAAVP
ncbi:MAG TPA: glycosyltransferase family 4 protein [Vicinamibacteria bacterium]|nr:glycosyltransferase family 4 protein [Vicinamibacteria bacterium]